jgi:hypothetical protein
MNAGIATAAFWLFLAVVVGSMIWRKTLQRREALITLRVAIEKGLALDDERLMTLLAAATGERRRRGVSPEIFLVLGALFAAGAACLGVLSAVAAFSPRGSGEFVPLLVFAIFSGIVAGTFLLLWRLMPREAPQDSRSRR